MDNSIVVNQAKNFITANEDSTQIVLNKTTSNIVISDIGLKGQDGMSAYEIAVEYGFIGTEAEWIAQNEIDLASKVDKTDIGSTSTNYVNIFLYNMLN